MNDVERDDQKSGEAENNKRQLQKRLHLVWVRAFSHYESPFINAACCPTHQHQVLMGQACTSKSMLMKILVLKMSHGTYRSTLRAHT